MTLLVNLHFVDIVLGEVVVLLGHGFDKVETVVIHTYAIEQTQKMMKKRAPAFKM
jgi:hypothetical protein